MTLRNRPLLVTALLMGVAAFVIISVALLRGREIRFVEYINEEYGFRSVLPEGWHEQEWELAGDMYVPDGDSLAISLTQTSFAQGIDEYMQGMVETFAADSFPPPVGTIEANGLIWQHFLVQVADFPWDIAMTEANGTTYYIALTSRPDRRDAAYEQIFLPVVRAFTPLQ
jgi:hypothetical protein